MTKLKAFFTHPIIKGIFGIWVFLAFIFIIIIWVMALLGEWGDLYFAIALIFLISAIGATLGQK